MRRVLLLLLLLGLPAAARASWAHVPLETLVQESDIVVVGTLRDVTEHTAGGTDYGQGQLVVREVVWGQVSPGDALLLKWSNPSEIMCPRVEHRQNAGEEGIWLLTAEGGHVEANYPGRFVGLKMRRQVEAALARYPVVLRAGKYFVTPGEALPFTVLYRNFSNAPRTFPGAAFDGGFLRLGPGLRLHVEARLGDEKRRLGLEGRVTGEGAPSPFTVAAGGEHRVTVNLRDLLPTEPVAGESYGVSLSLGGLRPTHGIVFHFGAAPSRQPELTQSPATPATDCYFVARRAQLGVPPHRRAMLTFVAAFSLYLWLRKFRGR